MARRLRFNGTGSGGDGCPSIHEDLDTGEIIIHGPRLTDPEDIARLRHLGEDEVPIVVPRDLLIDFGPKKGDRARRMIDLAEFGKLFETFEHTAWRLETRRRYASDETADTYAQFVAGNPVEWDYHDAWSKKVRAQTSQGKRFERVRLVDNPPTTGQLYLLDNAKRNCAVGEDIRSLWREEADRLRLPAEDFWLFDSRYAALLMFDDDDNLLGAEIITEPAAVNRYAQIRDAAWHHAVKYDEFAAGLAT
ncbi:DUF6879 family protein [Streptomyces sp. enrichment culture]|uniref:DUF6879 family protein n=1 Tax=Streptomyces sp. enrichment culture TaxID=1795815 RepID=UPI003F57CEC2